MNTSADDEMPKDLDRVYAALNAPTDPAPEKLLQRILASRAAGERVILPTGAGMPSRFRTRMFRWAIAAALGFVMLAGLSKWLRSRPGTSKAPSAAGFLLPGFDDLGFGMPAAAQGPVAPKFEPMTFDTSRLHPIRLQYAKRDYLDGKAEGEDSIRYSLMRSPGSSREWVVVMERVIPEQRFDATAVHMSDTVRMEAGTLHTWSETYAVHYADESSVIYRWTIGDTSAVLHVDDSARTIGGNRDTTFTMAESRYPRLVSSMNPAEFVFKLMAAPIEEGWKRSLIVMRPGGAYVKPGLAIAVIPVDVEVIGQERVATANGETDCWKIRRHSSVDYTYLIRRSDGVMISSRVEGTLNGQKYAVEMVLIGEQ